MGLTADLNVSVQSLLATAESMDVTTTNIANENTPGYARRTVVLEESAPVGEDGNTGVDVKAIQSMRDTVLDLSINAATSQQNMSDTVASSLSPVQIEFSDTASGSVGTSLDSFFSSLQQLSTSPSDTSLRNDVLTDAGNVASSFQSTAAVITQAQQQADRSVVQSTSDANSLLQQIAATNGEIAIAQSTGQSYNSDQDQLSNLLTQLSAIMDYQTVNSSSGLTLSTSNGIPLVVGNKAYSLTNNLDPGTGFNNVYAAGTDITSTIQGGTLGGNIQSRDQTLASLRAQLDQFAFDFGTAVNNVQDSGYDVNGNAVQGTSSSAFFNLPDVSTGAASSISVALTDGSQIAAAATSAGAPGDNSNLTNMTNLQNQSVIDNNKNTPTDAFANLTFSIANTISRATTDSTATGNILTQLKNQQGSVEGVSTDEESSNLLLYERSYQAAAKVISIIDTLMGNILDMGVTNPGY
jgi:flagellar hook-associated protein 1 FlgK